MATNQTSGISVVGLVGNLVSGIFKTAQTKDGFAKFIQVYTEAFRTKGIGHYPAFVPKFMNKQSMTLAEKKECTAWVLQRTRNWTKAQKKNLEQACKNIVIIPDPPKAQVPATHTISASYNTQGQTQQVNKSRDAQEVVQAGMPGIAGLPIYVLVGIGALLFLPQLLKGGKK